MSPDSIERTGRHERRADVVAQGIVVAALLLFVAFAAEAVPAALGALQGRTGALDGIVATALLTDVALLLFCWRTPPKELRTARN